MRLHNKVAIVTGSSRNIGLGIALRLAHEGAWVVVHGLDADEVDAAQQAVAKTGVPTLGVVADLSDAEGAAELSAQTITAFGHIDILINNAAITAVIRSFLDLTPELCNHILGVNLGGMLHASLYAARAMAKQGSGCIVNISSVGAARAHRSMVPYDASKGGIEAATRAMAVDLAPHGIRVNAVQPGLVRTARWNGVEPSEVTRRCSAIPLGREASADDVAGVVAFLCSDDAAYVTGQVLAVDGGLLAQLRTPDAELMPPPLNGQQAALVARNEEHAG